MFMTIVMELEIEGTKGLTMLKEIHEENLTHRDGQNTQTSLL